MDRSIGGPRGQLLVMASFALLVCIGVAGMLVDHAVTRARAGEAQEAALAVASAGATELATSADDLTIWRAVMQAAADRGIEIIRAEYTTARGEHLGAVVGPADATVVPARAAGIHVFATTRVAGILPIVGGPPSEMHLKATALAVQP